MSVEKDPSRIVWYSEIYKMVRKNFDFFIKDYRAHVRTWAGGQSLKMPIFCPKMSQNGQVYCGLPKHMNQFVV